MRAARALAALLLAASLAGGTRALAGEVSEISAQDLLASRGRADAPVVLDVRTPEEFASGHVPGAMNVPHEQVAARIGELGDVREVVVYCERGGRALKAAEVLTRAGLGVRHLTGDMSGWRASGLPIER